jgi:hypothetical protein
MPETSSARNPPQVDLKPADGFAEEIEKICRVAQRKLNREQFEDFLMTAGIMLCDWVGLGKRSKFDSVAGRIKDD